ncbi:MAG: polyphosphate polymerase domain-containing protein [Bacteroidota bacterium]|nr:polyphosphate polymerase domain-containing protein [Bacteroidota bacterium]
MPLRSEIKYIVPIYKMGMLREMITPFVELDKFARGREGNHYTVKSIYFDSPQFYFYNEKIQHEKHRKKVRMRGYNDENPTNTVFMEIKRKYEGPIFKNRAPMEFQQALEILAGKNIDDYVKNSKKFPDATGNTKRFMYQMFKLNLRPVVNVIYEREPFLGKNNGTIRVTFDKNLRSSPYPSVNDLYNEKRIRYALKEYFILEVKYNDYYPSWMKPIIGTLGLKKEPASKYTMCIDSHNMLNKVQSKAGLTFARFFNNNNNHQYN